MSHTSNPPIITHIDSGKIVGSGKKQLTELHQWASSLEPFQVGAGCQLRALSGTFQLLLHPDFLKSQCLSHLSLWVLVSIIYKPTTPSAVSIR